MDSVGQHPVSALRTGVSDTRSGQTATSQPQYSGRGCATNGETTDDR